MNPNPSHKKTIVAIVILVVLALIAYIIAASQSKKEQVSEAEMQQRALDRLSSSGGSESLTPEQQKAVDSLSSKEKPKTEAEQKEQGDALKLLQGN